MASPTPKQDFLRNVGRAFALWTIILWLSCAKSHCSLDRQVLSSKKDGNSLNFLVVGDWGRKGLYNQSQVAAQMGRTGEKLGIDFVISTGDNFYKSGLKGINDPSFEESFSKIYTAKSLQKQWYAVLGNHDYRGDVLAQLNPFLRNRDRRWYCQRSFTLHYKIQPPFEGGFSVDFFFVDTTPFVDHYWKASQEKYDWRGVIPRTKYLHRQLKDLASALKNSRAAWKIVVGHHTIRSVGKHGDTIELLHKLLPMLDDFGVDIYMNGHDHDLGHISSLTSPLQFLTSGGGSKAWKGMNPRANMEGNRFFYPGQGFMSVQATKKLLGIDFYDMEGKIIHRWDLQK